MDSFFAGTETHTTRGFTSHASLIWTRVEILRPALTRNPVAIKPTVIRSNECAEVGMQHSEKTGARSRSRIGTANDAPQDFAIHEDV